MEEKHQNLIIKRVKKGRHKAHGGAWKVAFADFAVAMMAFFMVLWLVNATDEEEKKAISGYFQDPIAYEEGNLVPSAYVINLGGSPTAADQLTESEQQDPDKILQAKDIENMAEAIERRRLESLMQVIQEKIDKSVTLKQFNDQLLLDITPEGLRIQIVDKTGRPMFDAGSAKLKYYSEDILFELASMLSTVDNKISVSGHTDSSGYGNAEDFGNWELSANRANAARRALVDAGVVTRKIAEVVGMGDSAHFNPDDHYAIINRRVAIVILNNRTEAAIDSRKGGFKKEPVKQIKSEPPQEKIPQQDPVEKSNDLIKRLDQARNKTNNGYDKPPPDILEEEGTDEEAFW
jgi:chemotaxis protein MotB